MQLGSLYNPRRLFYGVFVPDWLLGRKEISPGAKLCFAVLCCHAGDDGAALLSCTALGVHLGVSRRQVQTYLRDLEAAGVIATEFRPGRGRANRYRFPEHRWNTTDNS